MPALPRITRTERGYWEFDGEPTLLLGGSSEDNLFQVPNVERQLDELVQAGGNYVRCTMSSRDEGDVWPFLEREDGRYDLNAWNDEYWNRFDRFLRATEERGIVVQLEIWATFDYYSPVWEQENPFNPQNNNSYTAEATGLPEELEARPSSNQNPFFWTVPNLGDLEKVRRYQRKFVDKLLSNALAYPQVLVTIDNETHAPPQWGKFWANYIRTRAHERDRLVELTEMFWQPDLRHPVHKAVYDHPETYTFCEASQNNARTGEEHWTKATEVRDDIETTRPVNNVKIYGNDEGPEWAGSSIDASSRFWQNVLAGHASARFHRPPTGIGLSKRARRDIRGVRAVDAVVDLLRAEPRSELISDNSQCDVPLAVTQRGEYVVYFSEGGSVELQLDGDIDCRWYDIGAEEWAEEQTVSGTSTRLSTPHSGQWVAVLR